MEHFIFLLEKQGIEVKQGEHIVVKVPGIKRFKRLDTISEDFSRENLETMFKYKDASLASAVEHAMSLIPNKKNNSYTIPKKVLYTNISFASGREKAFYVQISLSV